jgi:hypothetical protein
VKLARGITLGDVGWAFNTEYEFTFDFGPNNLEVFVDGIKEIDISTRLQQAQKIVRAQDRNNKPRNAGFVVSQT